MYSSMLDQLVSGNPAPPPASDSRAKAKTWHQQHPAFRYEIKPDVYGAVAGITTALKVNNISTVAETMMDYALTMYDEGKVPMESGINPNKNGTRMVLTWEHGDGWQKEVKPDKDRKKRRNKLISAPRQFSPFGFRWARATHERVKALAAKYDVTLGEMVTRLLEYAANKYRDGSLKISIQMVAVRQADGWSEK